MWGIIGEIACDNFQHFSGIRKRLFPKYLWFSPIVVRILKYWILIENDNISLLMIITEYNCILDFYNKKQWVIGKNITYI